MGLGLQLVSQEFRGVTCIIAECEIHLARGLLHLARGILLSRASRASHTCELDDAEK